MKTQIRRKNLNFSVKRKMQIRLFAKILGISMTGVGIMAIVFYFYSDRAINSSYRQFHLHANNFLDLLLPAIVSSLALALIVSAVITLFLPIKIAGPLFRIERDLKEKVAKGDLTVRFQLRPGDEVSELANAINECLKNLGRKIKELKRSAKDLESIVTVRPITEGGEVRKIASDINQNLSRFKV